MKVAEVLAAAKADVLKHIKAKTFHWYNEAPDDGENVYTIMSLYAEQAENEEAARAAIGGMINKLHEQRKDTDLFIVSAGGQIQSIFVDADHALWDVQEIAEGGGEDTEIHKINIPKANLTVVRLAELLNE